MLDFRGHLPSLTLRQLREYASIINLELIKRQTQSPTSVGEVSSSSSTHVARNINDFVEYRHNYIDQTDGDLLAAECQTLNFSRHCKSDKVQNRFISEGPDPYIWEAGGGLVQVVNNPRNFVGLPVIKWLLGKVNCDFNCNLNSALVAYYKNGSVSARLHHDGEKSLDPSQPIVVVTSGAVRRVEFVDNNQESFRSSVLTIDPANCSVYVMKPGCQEGFRHRVRMDQRVKEPRISISFRCILSESDKVAQANTPSATTPNSVDFVTPDSKHSSCDIASSPHTVSGALQSITKDKRTEELHKRFPGLALPGPPSVTAPKKPLTDADSPLTSRQHVPPIKGTTEGYSPFGTSHLESSWLASTAVPPLPGSDSEKLCILLGTSITQHVDGSLMSKKGRTVVNLSASGANIEHLRKMAGDFHYENPHSIHKVDKIVVSVGTNDIKWYNCHINSLRREFKPKLIALIQDLKLLFPYASISFQTVLPIRIVYNYTVDSVHQFNNLLLEVCSQFSCTFFDCFSRFLDREGVHPNKLLYRDNWHLSDIGLKVLCRALKFLIYGNIFNPIPRYSIYSRVYPFYKH